MSSQNSYHGSNGVIAGDYTNQPKVKSNGHALVSAPSIDKKFQRRVWFAISVSCVCYVVSLLSITPLSVQYFSYRIAKDKYNFTYNDTNTKCKNASDTLEDQIDRVQKEASQILLISGIAAGIPACITCLLVGSYSDFLGRKPILLASMFGGFFKLTLLTLIVKLDWNIHLYYLGSVIDGILGSYFTLLMAATAIIADITPIAKNRAINFAIIEGVMLPTAASAQIGLGYMIRDNSFFLPTAILSGLLLVAIATNFLLLPETVKWRRAVSWDPMIHIKKVVAFYFVDNGRNKRLLYIIGLCAFVLVALTNIGKSSIETLFQLSYPLCWDSVEIGIYTAIKMVGMALVTIVFLRLTKNRLSIEVSGVICAVSGAAGFILFGLSKTGSEVYLSALVGILYFGCIPIPRALLSELTAPTEQGALFSSLSAVDTISSLVSSTLFTIIYNATIDSFKGAAFMLIAAFTLISIFFLIAFRYVRAGSALSDYTVVVEDDTDKHAHLKGAHLTSMSETAIDESSSLLKKE